MPPNDKPTEASWLTDEQAMRLAVAQAHAAQAAGEVPVGAVLVREGRVVATGANAPVACSDPTAHAEIVALRAAAAATGNYRLDGCTLYVTLEPCPMCAGAMLHARLARVVFGAADPRTGAAGSVTDLFAEPRLNHHTRVEGGVLAGECGALLQTFFRERRATLARVAEPLREDALRTARSAFAGPAASAWEGRYRSDLAALQGLRMHYVERGPASAQAGPVFVCLHGPADWGQRFAAIAQALEAQDMPVLVPDLIGFGRSDKPKRDDFHRLDWHVDVLRDWLREQPLPVVLVGEGDDPALAFALADALGDQVAGVVLLPAATAGRSGATAGHPDRGHAAALRAFAGGWAKAGSTAEAPMAPPARIFRLASEAPEQLQRAVEYFRA